MCVYVKDRDKEVVSPDETNFHHKGPITMDKLEFKVKLDDLKDLMQLKGVDAVEKIEKKFNGIESLAVQLHTDLQTGLNEQHVEQMEKRVQTYGINEIPKTKSKSIFHLLFRATQDATLIMLMICACVSIGLSFYNPSQEDNGDGTENELREKRSLEEANLEWVEGCAIMIAVLIVVLVTAFNDWRKERQFRGLQNRIDSDNLASVIRNNGQVKEIHMSELVVGDVCCIKYGDSVPADGIVIDSYDLKIDESSLTGETDLVKKNWPQNKNVILLSGTNVMEGSGKFLVTAVGIHSQTGIIMSLLGAALADMDENKNKKQENTSETPTKSGFFLI
jgi:Ca2+ transporting ATPase